MQIRPSQPRVWSMRGGCTTVWAIMRDTVLRSHVGRGRLLGFARRTRGGVGIIRVRAADARRMHHGASGGVCRRGMPAGYADGGMPWVVHPARYAVGERTGGMQEREEVSVIGDTSSLREIVGGGAYSAHLAAMSSRLRRAMLLREMPLGHSAEQAPVLVQLPKPSSSILATILRARRARST